MLQFSALAQYKVSGKVISSVNGNPVAECTIMLGQKYKVNTNSAGEYEFIDVKPGTYSLHCACPDFKSFRRSIEVNHNLQLNIDLTPRKEDLNEVVVTGGQKVFGNNRMKAVEGLGIYEGKKTEVIRMDLLTANLSTNNARQVFATVPGLNVWENDGSGLQLNIGSRGLDPNRTANFNVRQNGYDISADALGYPESYYTPPMEALDRIQLVRGAASLQFGPQFGGLLNFVMKKPVENKAIELVARQTIGSFNFYNSTTTINGTKGKFSYLAFFQYKKGDGWRPNSEFKTHTGFINLNYEFQEGTRLSFDYTTMASLAHQAGGLSDRMFEEDPRQSNRERNWFKVNWNLFALNFDHRFNSQTEINLRVFGLIATRDALGYRPNRVEIIDNDTTIGRELVAGKFRNIGAELRFLRRYELGGKTAVLLLGSRYYNGYNHSRQGLASTGKDADFRFTDPDRFISYNYTFPNQNISLFAENIFYLNPKFSVTPGARFEYLNTNAQGYYGTIGTDLVGNIQNISRTNEKRKSSRYFLLGGIGLSYKPSEKYDLYTNISQNYRSITFDDMRISNPSFEIDQNLKDESGYSIDLGIRTNQTKLVSFDLGAFLLNYNNRIGEIQSSRNFQIIRQRTNIGRALIKGLELFGEFDALHSLFADKNEASISVFVNLALISSEYTNSLATGVVGNKVEFVPAVNLKSGIKGGYKGFKASLQFTYMSYQYTDATNAIEGGLSAVNGLIPGYSVLDASLSYTLKRYKVELSSNNLGNRMYFSRRATGYPGPGILPADGRSFYLTLQIKL